MIDLRAHAQRFAEAVGADGRDHEFLNVQAVARVRAAVEDVHHRQGKRNGLRAAQKAEQRNALRARGGLCAGQGDGERRVGAEDRLVVCTIEHTKSAVHGGKIGRVHAGERLGDGGRDGLTGACDALAAEALHIPVAQLQRLEFARRRAAGRDGRASDAAGEGNLRLDGGVAPGIEHLTPQNADDFA